MQYTLGVAMLVCCDHVKLETDDFLKDFLAMEEGFIGFPINLPGTKYSKALKVLSCAICMTLLIMRA